MSSIAHLEWYRYDDVGTYSELNDYLVSHLDIAIAQSIAVGLGGTRFGHDGEGFDVSLRREISVGTRHNIVPSSPTAVELNAAGEVKGSSTLWKVARFHALEAACSLIDNHFSERYGHVINNPPPLHITPPRDSSSEYI